MKSRVMSLVLLAMLVATAAAAQQGTTEVRGKVVDPQGAVLPGVTVTVRNQDNGMFREAISAAEGIYFITRPRARRLRDHRRAAGVQEIRAPGRAARDREDRHGGRAAAGRIGRGDRHRDGRSAARRRHLEGGRRQHRIERAHRAAVDQPQLHRVHRPAARDRPEHQHRVVRHPTRSASTARTRGTTTTCSTAATTTTTSSGSARGRRRGPRSSRCRNSRSSPNQFDAQFGRTTGAIINAVTKSGTNRFRGSAFAFAQDAAWTEKDYFVENYADARNLKKPDTKRQEFGGTIGGPIIRDRMHFFGSLERVMIDRGAGLVFPSRPDLNWSPTTQDRVWNTLARVDNQFTANHTWGVRYLREVSPQRNQAIGQVTPGRDPRGRRQGPDGPGEPVVGVRQHEAEHVPRRLDAGGRGLREPLLQQRTAATRPRATPTLAFQTFTDQQANTAQARVNDAYQLEDTFSWFVPGQARRSRHQVRRPVPVRQGRQLRAGQPERHVRLRPEQSSVRRQQSADVSRPLHDPRAAARVSCLQKAHYITGFRAGQVEDWQPR